MIFTVGVETRPQIKHGCRDVSGFFLYGFFVKHTPFKRTAGLPIRNARYNFLYIIIRTEDL